MLNFVDLQNKKEKICVVGLGYVGLPLAVELSKHFAVVGLDVKEQRIQELKNGFDRTREVDAEKLSASTMDYSFDSGVIARCKFIIVAVPTPVNKDNSPDLMLVEKATEMVGKNVTKDSVVVYESTVYPGVTDDICMPILEKMSGLKCGVDFKVGYSPERINPGDKEHTISKVVKVVSGMDVESTDLISQVYGAITNIFKASSIRVAEAAKVIENTQRDINIALMNELAIIFDKLGFSIYDVLEAAGTKWNFLNFKPGLVGGHCIGVDPYYLTYKAEQIGVNPKVILAGRQTNDGMADFIVKKIIEQTGDDISKKTCVFYGITFKENVPDARNSKAVDIYLGLVNNGLASEVFDPLAYADEVEREYKIKLIDKNALSKADILVITVAHDEFKNILKDQLDTVLNPGAIIFDVKKILNKKEVESKGYKYWTL